MTVTEGTEYRFVHYSDFGGSVRAVNKETGEELSIPFEDLKMLLALWVRNKRISWLEGAEDNELLLGKIGGGK